MLCVFFFVVPSVKCPNVLFLYFLFSLVSLFHSVYLSLICLCSLSLSLSHLISSALSSLFLSNSFSVSLSLPILVFLFLLSSISVSLSLYLCLSFSVSVSVSLCQYLSFYFHYPPFQSCLPPLPIPPISCTFHVNLNYSFINLAKRKCLFILA